MIAEKHQKTRFIKAIATKVVENYRDEDLPAILIYKNADLVDKICKDMTVFGGKRMTYETVCFVLAQKTLIKMEFEDDPRDRLKKLNAVIRHKKSYKENNSDNSDDQEDDREYMNNQMFRYKHKV